MTRLLHCLRQGNRWQNRRVPSLGSGAWRYLCWARWIPVAIVGQAIQEGILREGPLGSMWAAHVDGDGVVVGWEERGPEWRGFSSRGSKTLFRLGLPAATCLCVTEAAIDAMSLAALEGPRENTLYLSTGGGWSPATDAALGVLTSRPGVTLVASTDANPQGDTYAERLRAIAVASGCNWQRLRPPADDWNEVLQNVEREKRERKIGKKIRPAACAPAASREASPGLYAYQWLRNGFPIPNATASTYLLVDADAGTLISASVTALNSFGGVYANSIANGIQGGGQAPSGYGFVQVGSPVFFQTIRIGSDSSAPRILIPTGG